MESIHPSIHQLPKLHQGYTRSPWGHVINNHTISFVWCFFKRWNIVFYIFKTVCTVVNSWGQEKDFHEKMAHIPPVISICNLSEESCCQERDKSSFHGFAGHTKIIGAIWIEWVSKLTPLCLEVHVHKTKLCEFLCVLQLPSPVALPPGDLPAPTWRCTLLILLWLSSTS